ncbi:MAG: HEAT repeat domain-containing protein, partial [Gammaproteobacteria bacterium]|nr:HEAT repeat domain-containing protein [Gammaproteobacteria bacterium]
SGCYSQYAYSNGWEHTSIDFNILVLALDDPNPNIRRRAAESLGFRQQAGSTDALLARLEKNEKDARVRQEIYGALGKVGEKTALGAIQACLEQEKDILARAQCAAALGNIDSELAEQLALKGIHDEDNRVRVQAVASLGSFRSAATVQALKMLVKDKSTPIKNTALLSLGRTGSIEATAVLVESLAQSSNREQALVSLQALTLLSNPDSAEAIRKVYTQSSDEEIKRYALVAMANTRAQGSESLFLDALSSEDSETRILGLIVLRNFGGPGEVPAIIERAMIESSDLFLMDSDQLLLDPTETIIKLQLLNEYLKTVIRLNPGSGEPLYARSSIPKLIPRTSSAHLKIAQGFYETRWQSLYGLGYTGTDKAGEIIKAALTDPDARIRAVATRSLGVLENPGHIDSVQTMLFDEVAEVRWIAARVLGRLNATNSIDALIEMLNDTSAQVRLESVLSLGYLNAQTAKQKLSKLAEDDPDQRVREAAVFAASLIE